MADLIRTALERYATRRVALAALSGVAARVAAAAFTLVKALFGCAGLAAACVGGVRWLWLRVRRRRWAGRAGRQAPLSRGDGVRDRLAQLVFAVLVEHLAAQSYHYDVRRADQRDSTMWRMSAFKEASRASRCSLSLALCLMPYQDACMRSQSCFAPGPEAGVRRVQGASISSSIAP